MDNLDKAARYAREHGMTYGQLQHAIATGKANPAEVYADPPKKPVAPIVIEKKLKIVNGKITYMGETYYISQWAAMYNINANTIRERIRRGVPADKVFYKGRLAE
ncbi:MAG: hypothetical protein IIV05_01545 [Ruminococcus sp.]|nr:hypothetical protein [Ruminococcus sp.]